MDHAEPQPHRSPLAWAQLAVCIASVCYSMWVMSSQATPAGFLARNGIVFLGIGMVAWATGNLLGPASRLKSCLQVVCWACLVAAFVGTYMRSH
jgi:hypothetical protein